MVTIVDSIVINEELDHQQDCQKTMFRWIMRKEQWSHGDEWQAMVENVKIFEESKTRILNIFGMLFSDINSRRFPFRFHKDSKFI